MLPSPRRIPHPTFTQGNYHNPLPCPHMPRMPSRQPNLPNALAPDPELGPLERGKMEEAPRRAATERRRPHHPRAAGAYLAKQQTTRNKAAEPISQSRRRASAQFQPRSDPMRCDPILRQRRQAEQGAITACRLAEKTKALLIFLDLSGFNLNGNEGDDWTGRLASAWTSERW